MDPLVREAYSEIGLPKPFIKWVGGKRQLLPELLSLLPSDFDGETRLYYYEPFLGGGAMFFEMWRLGLLENKICHLSDSNEELMNAFEAMRDGPERIIRRLKMWPVTPKFFSHMRKKKPASFTPISAAARFIYLNRTCFNGLYRVNQKGEFNVPFGRYKKPQLFDEDNFYVVSEALRLAHIWIGDFQQILGHISRQRAKKSFIYLDPPYVPILVKSRPLAYTDVGFLLERQEELAGLCEDLDKKGARWMLSNSNTSWVRKRYKAFKKHKVYARRSVNRDPSKRGKIAELIITNY